MSRTQSGHSRVSSLTSRSSRAKAARNSTSRNSRSNTLDRAANASSIPEPVRPAVPRGLPANDDEWENFFQTLSHNEDNDPPTSSMLSFVLSNLRVGMDLSKMPLPTWFMQKRSILEAYSDFFRHSKEFAKIAKEPTAEARILQCFRWFILGFYEHFHPLSDIAKKPFNSILGETYTTEFVIDEASGDKNEDSPWPWTSANNLIFYGEQVSHHPPISAFYVECPTSRIEASCYLQVVAKFRGFHIKAKNIGALVLNLIDLGEEYVIHLPIGFGRALLSKPWVEAGGIGTITCAKTGFSVEIEFLTKSLFSSERNKLKAKLLGPNISPKDAPTFEGRWDTKIEVNKTSKSSKLQVGPWLDVSQEAISTCRSRPFSLLPQSDSRKVWREVAWCIKNKQTEKANEFKTYVENVQRKQAAMREREHVEWSTLLFRSRPSEADKKTMGEVRWDFVDPLSRRGRKQAVAGAAAAAGVDAANDEGAGNVNASNEFGAEGRADETNESFGAIGIINEFNESSNVGNVNESDGNESFFGAEKSNQSTGNESPSNAGNEYSSGAGNANESNGNESSSGAGNANESDGNESSSAAGNSNESNGNESSSDAGNVNKSNESSFAAGNVTESTGPSSWARNVNKSIGNESNESSSNAGNVNESNGDEYTSGRTEETTPATENWSAEGEEATEDGGGGGREGAAASKPVETLV